MMEISAATQPGAPDWDALFSVAQAQSGYFTTSQAPGGLLAAAASQVPGEQESPSDVSIGSFTSRRASMRISSCSGSGRSRRLQVPPGLVLHHADIGGIDRTGFSVIEITTSLKTLRDFVEANVSPDLVRQAVLQARRRGLISEQDGAELNASLDHLSQVPR